MKKILRFCLSALLAGSLCTAFAQKSPGYKELREDGMKHKNAGNYALATSSFWAAMLAPDKPADNDLSVQIQLCQERWVKDLEASVQQQKAAYEAAESARKTAETAKQSEAAARQEAERNARQAREQGIRAESLRMALVSDMVRQKGRTSDALNLSYLALQMAGSYMSPPMLRAFSDAVRDSFVVPFYNSPEMLGGLQLLQAPAPGFLLKRNNGSHVLVRPGGNGLLAQVTEWKPDHTHVVASPQGDRFVGWGISPTAQVFDATGAVQAVLEGHQEPIRTAAFSPDGRQLVTGSRDNTARLWGFAGKPPLVLSGHSGNVLWAAFSPDGSFVLTRSSDGTARVWSAKDGAPMGVIENDSAYLYDVRILPDSKHIAAVFSDGQARLYTPDGRTGAVLSEVGQAAKAVESVASLVAVQLGKSTVRLYMPSGALRANCEHPANVIGMKLRPDGSGLATWAADHVVRLWDADGRMLRELRGHRAGILQVNFSPDGNFILTTSRDGSAKLWDIEGNIWTDWAAGSTPLAEFTLDGKAFVTTVNGGKSIAQMPLPVLVYRQMDRSAVLAASATKGVLNEFNVQFLDALQEHR